MKLFSPNLHHKTYKEIDFNRLKERGINTLFFDVDNTLVPHDCAYPDDILKDEITRLKTSGFQIFVISNNKEERVKAFADQLDLKYYAFALKPTKLTYRKIIKENQLDQSKIAIIGDQLLTDVLGGNRMGLFTIYTTPLVSRDINFTKINRLFEKQIIIWLKKHHKLDEGVIYE
ncbi:MAG: YqeG family HAD IIIA-type phosphatase [Erysipelotrichaceae bacterium]